MGRKVGQCALHALAQRNLRSPAQHASQQGIGRIIVADVDFFSFSGKFLDRNAAAAVQLCEQGSKLPQAYRIAAPKVEGQAVCRIVGGCQQHGFNTVVHIGKIERLLAARAKGGRIVAVGTTSLRLLETAARVTGTLRPFTGETDIFLHPGVAMQAADLLLTNFHLPRSTLLMLVAGFAGLDRIRAAYTHAIASGYRFYSYGDACLLERA